MKKIGTLIAMVFIISLLIPSCIKKPIYRYSQTDPGDAFDKAEQLFKAKDYKKSQRLYNQYVSQHPSSPLAPTAIMRIGSIHEIYGDYSNARGIFRYLMGKYPKSELVSDAIVRILMTFYHERNFREVIRQADTVLKTSLSPEHIAKIMVLVGDSYLEQGTPLIAVQYYAKVYGTSVSTDKENISRKLKTAMERLSTAELVSIMNTPELGSAKYDIMYQLGVRYHDEGQYEEASRVLSELIFHVPDHPYVENAKQLIGQKESAVQSSSKTIGCLLPLSGSYQEIGNKALRGIEFAISRWESSGFESSVSILFKDTESDPLKAVQSIQELAQENVIGIIGPIITSEQAASEAQRYGIPIIVMTQKENITYTGEFVFRNFITPQMQVNALVSYAVNTLAANNFGIFYPMDKYGTIFSDVFRQAVYFYGKEITAEAAYDPNQTDFRESIRQLTRGVPESQSKAGHKFDALFIPETAKKSGLLLPQLALYDLKNITLLGTNFWHSNVLIKLAKDYVQQAILTEGFFDASTLPQTQDFVRAFEQTYQKKPDFLEAIAYDTAMILFHLAKEPSVNSRVELADALRQLRDFPGVTGATSFDQTGEVQKRPFLLKIKGNKFIELESDYYSDRERIYTPER